MAKDFNQVIILGNLTRDPELRTTPSGQSVANFAVATNRSWNDASGERREEVEYCEVVAWGKLGELVSNYLSKGRRVLVVGRLQTRSWDGQDGTKKQRTEIIANDVTFVDRVGDTPGGGSSVSTRPAAIGEESQESTTTSKPNKSAAKKKAEDVVIEDLGDGEINLDDIPF